MQPDSDEERQGYNDESRQIAGEAAKVSELSCLVGNNQLSYRSFNEATATAHGFLKNGTSSPSEMFIPRCKDFEPNICHWLKTAMLSPPVTRTSLSELDLNWILHNISLRVDVNYDHDLHFMPIKGLHGEQKRLDAVAYWLALAAEFQIYQHNSTSCEQCQASNEHGLETFPQRLPKMFEKLKELLNILVPDKDHAGVAQCLDIPLLMQEVEKGALDIVHLSNWLASLLKSHCAPMRDQWADEMALTIEEGFVKADMGTLVGGLEKLFSFLEAMKLDVANHQIRTFRFPLIEDTVSFQQGFFGKRIEEGKLNPRPSQTWYENARREHSRCCPTSSQNLQVRPFESLLHGLLGLCIFPGKTSALPGTLWYDQKRIRQFQEDVLDIIHLRACLVAFNNLVHRLVGGRYLPPETYITLQWRLMAIVENATTVSSGNSWQDHAEELAIEITRAAYIICQRPHSQISDVEFKNTNRCLVREFALKVESIANELHAKLEQMTCQHASVFRDMSALSMSETQKQWQQNRWQNRALRSVPDLEDMARRLAHMSGLHWRIWAELVYLRKEDNIISQDDTPTDVLAPRSPRSSDDEFDPGRH